MPQLAPVNWLFLFLTFWSIVMLSSILIWWSSKTEYEIMKTSTTSSEYMLPNMQTKSWNW